MQSLDTVYICTYDPQGWSAARTQAVAPARGRYMITVIVRRSAAEHVGSVSPLRGSPHEDAGLVLVADVTRGGCKELAGLFSNILNTLCQSTYANLRISPQGIQPGDPEDRRNLPCPALIPLPQQSVRSRMRTGAIWNPDRSSCAFQTPKKLLDIRSSW